MIRRPPRSTLDRSSAASDVYKRQVKAFVRRCRGRQIIIYTGGIHHVEHSIEADRISGFLSQAPTYVVLHAPFCFPRGGVVSSLIRCCAVVCFLSFALLA